MPYNVTRIKEIAEADDTSFMEFYLAVLDVCRPLGKTPSKQAIQAWWNGVRVPVAYESIVAEAQKKQVADYYDKIN